MPDGERSSSGWRGARAWRGATVLLAAQLGGGTPAYGQPVTTIVASSASAPRAASGIAVQVSTTAPITVGSTDLVLTFDPTVVQATSVASSTLDGFTSNVNNAAGQVRTASASGSGDGLAAGDVLFTVLFSVVATAPLGPSPLGIVDGDGVAPDDLGGVPPPIPPPAILYTSVSGTFTVTACSATCGDVDGDGAVRMVDALSIAQLLVGLRPTLLCPLRADVNQSGVPDLVDALFIAQRSLGLRPSLSCSPM